MNSFLEFLYFMIAVILSSIIFTIIFGTLNQSVLGLFVPIQKLTSRIKKKKLVENIAFIVSIVLCVVIKDLLKLNYVWFGIIIGFLNSLTNVIFDRNKREPKNIKS